VKPVPGFEVEVERRTLDEPVEAEGGEITEVVSKVTWTGGPIEPGQFQQFDVSAGPLPDDLDKLEFPALQTYEGGEVVRWIEEVPADGEEPEHPVPTLTLVASTGDAHGGGDDEATEEEGEAEEAETDGEAAATTDESSSDSDTLAIVALIVGGLGVVLGGLALIRRRTP
jgi:periplasmic copper chaperone A